MSDVDDAKARFFKEVDVLDAFLLGVQSTATVEVAGAINNIRRNNLRWLSDHLYAYAAALVKSQSSKGS